MTAPCPPIKTGVSPVFDMAAVMTVASGCWSDCALIVLRPNQVHPSQLEAVTRRRSEPVLFDSKRTRASRWPVPTAPARNCCDAQF